MKKILVAFILVAVILGSLVGYDTWQLNQPQGQKLGANPFLVSTTGNLTGSIPYGVNNTQVLNGPTYNSGTGTLTSTQFVGGGAGLTGISGGGVNGVYVDSVNGSSGGTGTPTSPTDTIPHAITIAAANKYTNYYLAPGSYTMPATAVSDMNIYGAFHGGVYNGITQVAMNNCVIGAGMAFHYTNITGTWTTASSHVGRFDNCCMVTAIGDVGDIYYCLIDTLTLSGNSWLYGCYGEMGYLNGTSTITILHIVDFKGTLILQNFTYIGTPTINLWNSDGARVYIAASCTKMTLNVYGNVAVNNDGGANCQVIYSGQAGNPITASTTINLNQAASTYTLFTDNVYAVDITGFVIQMPNSAAGGSLTSISVQTDDTTPQVLISSTTGAVAHLTARNQLSWTGFLRVRQGGLITLTIAGGANGSTYTCNCQVMYSAEIAGGYLN